MYVEGTFTGFRDTIFEVEIMNDTDKYRWRNFTSTRDGASVAWSETHVISNKAVELHDGLSVYWLTLQGKTAGMQARLHVVAAPLGERPRGRVGERVVERQHDVVEGAQVAALPPAGVRVVAQRLLGLPLTRVGVAEQQRLARRPR